MFKIDTKNSATFKNFQAIHSIKSQPEREQQLSLTYMHAYAVSYCPTALVRTKKRVLMRPLPWFFTSSTNVIIVRFVRFRKWNFKCILSVVRYSFFVHSRPQLNFLSFCFLRVEWMIHTRGNEACSRFWFAAL